MMIMIMIGIPEKCQKENSTEEAVKEIRHRR